MMDEEFKKAASAYAEVKERLLQAEDRVEQAKNYRESITEQLKSASETLAGFVGANIDRRLCRLDDGRCIVVRHLDDGGRDIEFYDFGGNLIR